MISNAHVAACTKEYSSLLNPFKALMICSSYSQYISDIMLVAGCALDMVGEMSQNRSLKGGRASGRLGVNLRVPN